MPSHHEFIDSFSGALLSDDLPLGATSVDAEETKRRFDVYRNNVATGLSRALAARYPVIEKLVGPEFFAGLARLYAAAHRPQTPILHAWGDGFADFLAEFPPLAAYSYMPDVARIEYARGEAYHAADASPLQPSALAGADPKDLRLGFHPSLRILRLATPAVTIWQNHQVDPPRPLTSQEPEIALIWRTPSFDVPVHAMSQADEAFVLALKTGETLQRAAEIAYFADEGHDATTLLARLVQGGALTAIGG